MSLLNEENNFYNADLLDLLKDSNEAVLPYKRIRFRRNQKILTEGAETTYFYIIEDGVVSMSKNTCKEDSIISFLGKQDSIGPLTLLGGAKSPANYTSISEVSVYQFERKYVLNKLLSTPDVFWQMNSLMQSMVSPMLEREAYVNLPSSEKVLAGLIACGERFGRIESDGSCLIPYYFTQKILGNYLNLARAYVATNLRKLEEDGVISLSPKPWRITDFENRKQNLSNTYK
ncbi:Crp/Fnr family transcriptional regulator [Listeria innocua]|uniref:Crp/Fnr family transcriptional regulator n=1 Tax=Listeria innocua TaxID=1642 RepID=UPI0001EBB0B0|nr:Crp/Fnr family transcriptional regulator [Listeria innocua]EFR91685.1 CRP/FNR family transcription regulator [Listeria innocua FSL S4-378]EAD5716577.1 Crp/Fnr family transcriptional regulator [Listeria innocua]EAH4448492.1 Crp/Fnr family transcriptional regulator [Listeria innocua]EDO1201185.1 cyclic nucleotide-binding domain-containing protein [Listeria innocua]EKO3230562.1 Crp/Fnr family transcriptional regulator [Listeria innocua]